MKQVIMKVNTYHDKALKIGDVVDVSEEVAVRWETNGIAEIVEETEEVAIEDMSAKELFALCKARKIELEKTEVNGKSEAEKKAYLLSMLKVEAE